MTVGKYTFEIRIKLGAELEEMPFDGRGEHIAVITAAHPAILQLARGIACTPGWHSVALHDGSSVVLRPCLEYQLHLCLKHCKGSI